MPDRYDFICKSPRKSCDDVSAGIEVENGKALAVDEAKAKL
jgi:hypothetical protein